MCDCITNFDALIKAFHEGTASRAFEFFGCHRIDENNFVFRVWAPHAVEVSLILNHTFEDEKAFKMSKLSDNEIFEITAKAQVGNFYVYRITTFDGRTLYKADPYAFCSALPRSYSSVVFDIPKCRISNSGPSRIDKPINIYEVSLLSWKRHKDNSYYSFRDLEKELVPYVRDMGYTHVEFMPINEFPYDGSWGYQVTGYFSVISRLGTLNEFLSLVDAFHANGILVIVDWVPAHFPKDEWGLYEFDGQPLYESPLWDRMEHKGWGTRKFDFGRGEVESFLLSSATYLFERLGIDGLRVDAVASMLYLDYDKENGKWTPNKYGDNRNLEAIDFVKKLNSTIKLNFPDSMMIAEDSTAFDGVTRKVTDGGLGFDYKWNMGWMHDTLFYCNQDPYYRNYHHVKITFSLVYAFSENYILPLSHDEVVHVKGSILNKMFGEYEDKFSGERILLAYMYAHPGKKLNFMGYEFGQFSEWNYNSQIDFFLKEYELHRKMTVFVKDLNYIYRRNNPLFEVDNTWDGFKWLVVDDKVNNLLAFSRYDKCGNAIVCIINFSGADIYKYRIGIDEGTYRVILNTDSEKFGGQGKFKTRILKTRKQPGGAYISINIPRLTCVYLKKDN